jgi:polar amino acid transport system permease protein
MGWFGLLFGPDGWAPLLFRGALITILLSLVTVPFGFGAGLLLALLKLSRNWLVSASRRCSTCCRGCSATAGVSR